MGLFRHAPLIDCPAVLAVLAAIWHSEDFECIMVGGDFILPVLTVGETVILLTSPLHLC